MFEETTLYKSSLCEVPTSSLSYQKSPLAHKSSNELSQQLSDLNIVSCWHQHHQCTIRQWIAQGYVKAIRNNSTTPEPPKIKWFLYIEYQDKTGSNRYLQKRFNTLSEATRYAGTEALTQVLPYCISP